MSSWIDPHALMRIKNLSLRTRWVVDGFMKGIHRSPHHGFSVEFSEYRQYSPGDDPRQLDWKLFARSDRYFVKRFEDETNLRAMLVVDASRSMLYESIGYAKFEYARTAAATLARFLSLQHDAVGLIRFEDRVTDFLPPKHRPGHLHRLMGLLDRSPHGRATDLVGSLDQVLATTHGRGLVVLFSDFLASVETLLPRLRSLRAQGQDVILFRILDPAELTLPFAEPALFRDLETGREVDSDPTTIRSEYLRRFANHADQIKTACVEMGATLITVPTDRPLEMILFDFLQARARRGQPLATRRGGRI